ncbi:MAG: 4-vinyl reductase [Deltaproteobacteria bacterium]|jgi:predicted hydrocarbon binding protein|nr:4-vinyl reductase [Deltaproteobacteria bacterium]
MIENIFMRGQKHSEFSWENLGDIKEGRGDLGEYVPVKIYRLMMYTMLSVMSKDMGEDKANDYFREAGFLAGTEFAKHELSLHSDLSNFISELQSKLKDYRVCILRLEEHDPATGNVVVSAYQDLDCSGLPITNETVCHYDEGFISGILTAYSGKKYSVKEVDCWANGNRVCRFKGGPEA